MNKAYNPEAFWFSKVRTYRTCPTLYKLQHIDGIKFDDSSLDMELGTAVHLGLNDILQGGDGLEAFSAYFNPLKDANLKTFGYNFDELKNCGEVWLSRFQRLHAKFFEPFKMEERIFAKMGPHLFEGTPDFLGNFKGVPSILDFKTSSKSYDLRKIISDEQMTGYAELARQEYGYNVEQAVYFVFVKDRKEPSIQTPIIRKLTSVEINSTISNISATCDEIKARTHFTRNTENCVRGTIICPAFDKCWKGEK